MSSKEIVNPSETDPLNKVYNINERIKVLQEKIEKLQEKSSRKGTATDNVIIHKIEDLNVQISELIHERTRELKKVRWSDKRAPRVRPTKPQPAERVPSPVSTVTERVPTPVPRVPTPPPVVVERVPTPDPTAIRSVITPSALKITGLHIGVDSTKLIMVPVWFKPDNIEAAMNGIVYPMHTIEREQLKTVARFRTSMGKSKDFNLHPVYVSEQSTEVLVLSLEAFAQQFGGQLSFTSRDLTFDNSAESAACGIPNLGSAHLLANDSVPTANLTFYINLDYDKQLARSRETMENFITNFAVAISQILGCKSEYIRVFSIDKSTTQSRVVEVHFGLTTPNQTNTESLVSKLLELARKGFGENEVLRLIQLREYECKWRSVLSFLELKPSDFDTRYNFDYTKPGLPEKQTRGNEPYYLPLGWYRHALNVSQKYIGDTVWLDHNNTAGEWPVAFHGTHSVAVSHIMKDGLSLGAIQRDRMIQEAIQQKGPAMNKPGLYLATHCNGGSDAYATTFTVTNGDKTETFQVVFQCRVKPDSFTTHTSCVSVGHGWRVIDPTVVRPYGLLVRKKDS